MHIMANRLFPAGPWRCALLAGALIFSMPLAASAQAPAADPVVAKVDGIDIHESDVALAEEELGASLPQDATPEARRNYLITHLVDMILLSRAAEEQGLSGSDDFKRRFAAMRTKLLAGLMLRQIAQKSVNEEAMHKVYDDAIKQMGDEQEVRARHILVETEDQAKAVQADLKKGADFAELAKQKSKDPAAADGGDLGYFTKDQMVPEFADVAFKLDKGQISDPVKTAFGWHIIKVEDKRKKPAPTYDQVKDQLATVVVQQSQADLVNKLRNQAKIERMNAPPPAAPAANAPAAAGAAPEAATKK
ncbi:MAG: peptidylprolyl isomerase [Xanthobacteraceae bacterium]|nr:peptidylprolyl isomerase [Xanthobacteraceae bacterium]